MVTDLYVNNYKTLVNFKVNFRSIGVLIGKNGCGKSTVFQVISAIKGIAIDHKSINEEFSAKTLSRWLDLDVQTIELSLRNKDHKYQYHIDIEYNREEGLSRVKNEEVFCDGNKIFSENCGRVTLYNDSYQPGAEIVLDWNYSGVSMVAERRDNRLLSEFKRELDKVIVCSPKPFAVIASSSHEISRPKYDFSDAVSVYRYLLQAYPEKTEILNGELRKIFSTYARAYMSGIGEEKTLMFGFWAEGKEVPIHVTELSEGELQIFILYLIALYYIREGYMVFIDEPDNYVSLNEIQPWCMMVEESVEASSERTDDGCTGQCVMISHHREIVDYFAQSAGIWMTRNGNPSSRIIDTPVTEEAMSFSDMILLGGVLDA